MTNDPSLIDDLVLAFRRTLAEAVSSPRAVVVGDGHDVYASWG